MLKHTFKKTMGITVAAAILFSGSQFSPTAHAATTTTSTNATISQESLGNKIIRDARRYLGRPYVFGAAFGQTRTFDCSTLTKTVFKQNGIFLPRVSRNQALEGKFVSKKNLRVGDLVFFTTTYSKGKIGHVGIYAGNGQMIHTYGEGGVKFSSIHSKWWTRHYVTARRVI